MRPNQPKKTTPHFGMRSAYFHLSTYRAVAISDVTIIGPIFGVRPESFPKEVENSRFRASTIAIRNAIGPIDNAAASPISVTGEGSAA